MLYNVGFSYVLCLRLHKLETLGVVVKSAVCLPTSYVS